MVRLTVISAAVFALGGCASMSANECEFSDWYTIGVEDGTRGKGSDGIEPRRKACAKHGFSVDFDAYQRGRTAGLQEYCQPQRGFDVGAAGRRYRGVCPAQLEPAFLDAYEEGAQLHSLTSAVNNVQNRINARERELQRLRDDIVEFEQILIADETTQEDRVRVLNDLKQSNELVGKVEAEIDQLISERALRQADLADYEQWLAGRGWSGY